MKTLYAKPQRSLRPSLDAVHDALMHWLDRNPRKPGIILAHPFDMRRWWYEIRGGAFIEVHPTRSCLAGFSLSEDMAVSEGTLLLCDRDFRWIGTVRFG